MWHDEGTHIYSVMGDGLQYFLELLFGTVYAFLVGIPFWGYAAVFVVVVILILFDRTNIGVIVATNTDKSQGGTP